MNFHLKRNTHVATDFLLRSLIKITIWRKTRIFFVKMENAYLLTCLSGDTMCWIMTQKHFDVFIESANFLHDRHFFFRQKRIESSFVYFSHFFSNFSPEFWCLVSFHKNKNQNNVFGHALCKPLLSFRIVNESCSCIFKTNLSFHYHARPIKINKIKASKVENLKVKWNL